MDEIKTDNKCFTLHVIANPTADRTLDNIRCMSGDFIDVAYITTSNVINNNGSVSMPNPSFNSNNGTALKNESRGGFSIRGGSTMQGGGRYNNLNARNDNRNDNRTDNRNDSGNRWDNRDGMKSIPRGEARDLERWSKRSEQSRPNRRDNEKDDRVRCAFSPFPPTLI